MGTGLDGYQSKPLLVLQSHLRYSLFWAFSTATGERVPTLHVRTNTRGTEATPSVRVTQLISHRMVTYDLQACYCGILACCCLYEGEERREGG